LFLFSQDDLNFKKKNEFIIYIGTHGDKGAEIADIILPGAAYTEQDGYFTNLEGKIQKAFKASYPPGEATEDWKIVNDLSKLLKRKKLYNNKEELIDSMMNYIKLNKKDKNNKIIKTEFLSEKILIDPIDYYYSNAIARASNTMSECRNEKLKIKSTGTDG
jgi:NADH-quinone oxidoreductase subunit G